MDTNKLQICSIELASGSSVTIKIQGCPVTAPGGETSVTLITNEDNKLLIIGQLTAREREIINQNGIDCKQVDAEALARIIRRPSGPPEVKCANCKHWKRMIDISGGGISIGDCSGQSASISRYISAEDYSCRNFQQAT